MEEKYRHEIKYLCSIQEIAIIKQRLSHVLSIDKNAKEKGSYSIRSLYFDDYFHTCFKENEAGTDPREKFRIRIYNQSVDKLSLELKKKQKGKTLKKTHALSLEQCQTLMQGDPLPIESGDREVANKLSLLMWTRRMRPVIIVEYERIPFVYTNGNVRITLDMNISSSGKIDHFLDSNIAKRPILGFGQHILEVKYDEYLPDFIANTLQLGTLKHMAFSKYYLCRKFYL